MQTIAAMLHLQAACASSRKPLAAVGWPRSVDPRLVLPRLSSLSRLPLAPRSASRCSVSGSDRCRCVGAAEVWCRLLCAFHLALFVCFPLRGLAQDAPAPDASDAADVENEPESRVPDTPPVANDGRPDEGAPGPDEGAPPVDPQAVIPPRVITRAPAVFPPAALNAGREADVTLAVTVQADGRVGDVEVVSTGGAEFDEAAIVAVRQWRFTPASRGGQPMAARIHVPFAFRLPEVQSPDPVPTGPDRGPQDQEGQEDDEDPDPADPLEEEIIEVTVDGEREHRPERRSVSDFRVARDVVRAAPRQEGAEVLRSAPGVYIGRSEGPAVAHNYMLRGFDAEHGQDIAFRVAGIPINMPSHIHGQGYADLGFLIGDVVLDLDVSEGVYDPRQGDFAVAGSIDMRLGVAAADRGVRLRSSYGAFRTFRQTIVWAPEAAEGEEVDESSFAAAHIFRTDGFGENRRAVSGSVIVQQGFGSGPFHYRLFALAHAARSDLAGVVRRDDVASGLVCFQCVYDLPTAQAQNALANRFVVGFFADYAADDGANGSAGIWFGYDGFRIQENFTGFIEQSRTLERVAGRGDLIEQQNRTLSLGLTGRYRTRPFRPTSWLSGSLEVGVEARLDLIEQSQALIDPVRNQVWDNRVDAGIRGLDIGVYGDLDVRLSHYVVLRVGARSDVLSYDVDDRLGNFVPLTRPQDGSIVGYRRSALGVAAGPRVSVEVEPLESLSVMAAYGEGYRSPQARTLDDGERAPFTKVRSADLGVRYEMQSRPGEDTAGTPFGVGLSGYFTQLSDDVVFEASEGRLERIGATRRLGLVLHTEVRPVPWLVGAFSLTYVHATLLEPPPATREEPQPAFAEGQNIPFVPPVVARLDVGATHRLAVVGGKPLIGRAGLGLSVLSRRPLPFGDFAEPFALLDVSVGVDWGALGLSFELFNATNTRYGAVEYSFASDWTPSNGTRTRTPARHSAAGSPLSFMFSLEVRL